MTPDGRYLVFVSGRLGNEDEWWVDAEVLRRLGGKALAGFEHRPRNRHSNPDAAAA